MTRRFAQTAFTLSLLVGSAACAKVALGIEDNPASVQGGIETVDVKAAIVADKTIDSRALEVETYRDTKTVVLRGTVPTEEQKLKAESIARKNATSYKIDNRIVVRR